MSSTANVPDQARRAFADRPNRRRAVSPAGAWIRMLDIRPPGAPTAVEHAVHRLRIKGSCINALAGPLNHLIVIGMSGVLDRLEKVIVAGKTPDVLGRARPPTAHHDRVPLAGDSREDPFQHDLMLPAIAEVVLVEELVLRSA
jgi:hypothetical protein